MAIFDADDERIAQITAHAARRLIPPPRLKLSEWIPATIRLPSDVSALPGPMNLFPPQVGIADAIGDPDIERVTLQKAVRVGLSSLITAAIASFASNDPCPILILLPTDADCRDYMVSDVEPIFAASPALASILSDDSEEGERNSIRNKRFPGGSLKVIAARSPRGLRRHNARVLLCDEIDAMETARDEGNVLLLAERRTLSFPDRKIVVGSTPTLQETSHVIRCYEQSDQRVYECPCPDCGAFTEIMWRHIEWEPGKPKTAAFRCPHCSALVPESAKGAMVAAGRWRATRPEVTSHAGFRINALVSLLANARWPALVTEFLAAKDNPADLQVFTNTILAEGWSGTPDAIDELALLSRVEPIGLDRIPREVLSLSLGVDCQDSRLECAVAGWDAVGTCFVLAHLVFHGPITEEAVWRDLDDLLATSWKSGLGGQLRIDACAVDAGDGQHFQTVMNFTAPRFNRRVYATKGVPGTQPAWKRSDSTRAKAGQHLFLVGVDGIKATIAGKLAAGRTIRFSDTLTAGYFEELTSERRVTRFTRGIPSRIWERIPGRRAEALDALVYAMAVHHGNPVNLQVREAQLRLDPVASVPPPAVFRSRYLTQGRT